MTKHEFSTKLSPEDLAKLSSKELTELCFEQQFPEYQHSGQPLGYLPAEAEPSISAIHDLRPTKIARLALKGQLQKAAADVEIPKGARPVYEASRQFYSDRSTGKWLTTEGGESKHFKIINRVLLYTVPYGEPNKIPASEETLYEFTTLTSYYAQGGRESTREHQRAKYEAEFDWALFAYTGSITPPWHAEELTSSELRQLLVEWGQLGRVMER